MKLLVALAEMLAVSAVAFSQSSFDDHFALAKQGLLGSREASFAKRCGVNRTSSQITYGRSLDEGWHFKRVTTVGNGRNDAEMDYLGNAEVWSVSGKARLLNVWYLVMDTGHSTNELFCLDQQGHVVMQESLNVYESPENGTGWRRRMIAELIPGGHKKVLADQFLDKDGPVIAVPKLSADDLAESKGHSSPDLASVLIMRLLKKGK